MTTSPPIRDPSERLQPIEVALALGANVGPSAEQLAWAIGQLHNLLKNVRTAEPMRFAAESPIPQSDFLNTALVGLTTLAAEDLLAVCKALEKAAGRTLGPRYGSRPLDIDLLLYGDRLSRHPELTLPHPRLRHRAFVLCPLAAIAPRLEVPPDGARVEDLLAALESGICP